MLTEPGSDGATSSPTETKRRLPRAPLHFRRNGGRRNGGGAPPGTRRNTVLLIALVAVITASAVGWVAGRRIQSPAEIASRTAPPSASLITVPVELRTLTSDVVARGTVRYGSPQTVTLPASPLKPGTSIVSIAPVKGAALNEGSVALVGLGPARVRAPGHAARVPRPGPRSGGRRRPAAPGRPGASGLRPRRAQRRVRIVDRRRGGGLVPGRGLGAARPDRRADRSAAHRGVRSVRRPVGAGQRRRVARHRARQPDDRERRRPHGHERVERSQ